VLHYVLQSSVIKQVFPTLAAPHEVFSEIQTATDAQKKRMSITESELVEIKESMGTNEILSRTREIAA